MSEGRGLGDVGMWQGVFEMGRGHLGWGRVVLMGYMANRGGDVVSRGEVVCDAKRLSGRWWGGCGWRQGGVIRRCCDLGDGGVVWEGTRLLGASRGVEEGAVQPCCSPCHVLLLASSR